MGYVLVFVAAYVLGGFTGKTALNWVAGKILSKIPRL